MDQCPELGSPISEAQACHLAGAPRLCLPPGSEEKKEKKERKKKKERKMQKANHKSTVDPKVHCLNFGMICCLFSYSTDAGSINLIVEI